MRGAILLVVTACAAACGPDFDPESYLAGNLRVLGVRAEPPEIAPGEETTLTVQLPAGQEDATIEWAYCTLPSFAGAGFVNPDCAKEETAPHLVPLGTGRSVRFTMPNVRPETGELGLPDATSGFYVPVRADVRRGPDRILVFYRARVHLVLAGQPPNQNPTLTEMTWVPGGPDVPDGGEGAIPVPIPEGQPIEVAAGTRVALRANAAEGSTESYLRLRGDPRQMEIEQVDEVVRLFWFTTAGEFNRETTGIEESETVLDLAIRPPSALPATVDVYVLARDERGGTSAVLHRQLRVLPAP